jgi:hypothetical protein
VVALLGRGLGTAEVLRDRSTGAGRSRELPNASGKLVIDLAAERIQRPLTELHQLVEKVFWVVGA